MKNVFYFILKSLFVLEIFKFLSWLFGYVEERLDKKTKVNFKVYDITDWTTNILSNISGSKDNQTMKFRQFIKYNMKIIFLKKSYTKYCGEASARPFSKKIKTEYISSLTDWNFTRFVFIVYPSGSLLKHILKLKCWSLVFALY